MTHVILVATSDIPFLWMWKLRHKEVLKLLQGPQLDVAEKGCV